MKSRTRQSFGRRSRFRKPRGRNAATRAPAADDNDLVSSRSSPVPPEAAAAVAAAVPESATLCEPDLLTAFERKIRFLEEASGSDGSTEDAERSGEPCGDGAASYRLVDVACLRSLVKVLLCPTCRGSDLELRERGTGAHLTFVVECPTCEAIVSAPLSSTIDSTRQTELPARLVIAARNCGIGFTKLTDFFYRTQCPSADAPQIIPDDRDEGA